MRHLTIKELLRHFDGQLPARRSDHISVCAFCQDAMVGLQDLLYEVELGLKRSVPDESMASRGAALERLRRSMVPVPQAFGMTRDGKSTSLGWLRPAYGFAAAVLVAFLGGYMAFTGLGPTYEAQKYDAPSTGGLEPSMAMTTPASNVTSSLSIVTYVSAPKVLKEAAVALQDLQPEERFEVVFSPPAPRVSSAVLVAELPEIEILLDAATSMVVAPAISQEQIAQPLRFWELPSASNFTMATAATLEDASILVDGHWLMFAAGVWQQDLRPEVGDGKLHIIGTVENETVRRSVLEALSQQLGQGQIVFDVSSRNMIESVYGGEKTFLDSQHIQSSSQRPSGGVVRTSLLAHFRDTARRSFQVPEPSLLEAELDHYVNQVFRRQSDLLVHAYALNRVLDSLDLHHVDELSSARKDQLRDIVRFHSLALQDGEADLYDRLSEVLPRRYWAYKVDKVGKHTESDWMEESKALLENVLALDSTLTSLLSALPGTVSSDMAHYSCGELLGNIRGHLKNLRTSLKTLQ